jgi:hypothetical protein
MSTGGEVRSALTERKRREPVGQKDASWIDGGDEKKKGREDTGSGRGRIEE